MPALRWARDSDETNSLSAMEETGLLSLTAHEFAEQAMVLPAMQFCSAQLLIPRLQRTPGASYTFVTGGAGEMARTPLGQVNAQAVWGLAAALRQEARAHDSQMRCSEVRVGIKFNRTLEERRAAPREQPLSHDLGTIVAGVAAAAEAESQLHRIYEQDAVGELKAKFPVVDKGFNVFFSPQDLMF